MRLEAPGFNVTEFSSVPKTSQLFFSRSSITPTSSHPISSVMSAGKKVPTGKRTLFQHLDNFWRLFCQGLPQAMWDNREVSKSRGNNIHLHGIGSIPVKVWPIRDSGFGRLLLFVDLLGLGLHAQVRGADEQGHEGRLVPDHLVKIAAENQSKLKEHEKALEMKSTSAIFLIFSLAFFGLFVSTRVTWEGRQKSDPHTRPFLEPLMENNYEKKEGCHFRIEKGQKVGRPFFSSSSTISSFMFFAPCSDVSSGLFSLHHFAKLTFHWPSKYLLCTQPFSSLKKDLCHREENSLLYLA